MKERFARERLDPAVRQPASGSNVEKPPSHGGGSRPRPIRARASSSRDRRKALDPVATLLRGLEVMDVDQVVFVPNRHAAFQGGSTNSLPDDSSQRRRTLVSPCLVDRGVKTYTIITLAEPIARVRTRTSTSLRADALAQNLAQWKDADKLSSSRRTIGVTPQAPVG